MRVYCVVPTFIFIALLVVIPSSTSSSKTLVSSKKSNGEFYAPSTDVIHVDRSRSQTKPNCKSLPLSAESWYGHNEVLHVEYFASGPDQRVQIYADNSIINQVDRWIFNFTRQVWDYMTKTYGDFHSTQCLYVILHRGRYAGGRVVFASYYNSTPANLNILDIGSTNPNAWQSKVQDIDEMNLITNSLAYFVEFSSHKRYGSPSKEIWKGSLSEHSPWVDIFTYDVYKSLGYTTNAVLYRKKSFLKSHNSNFLKNQTFWFRDWFLPIYVQFKGNSVLSNYFIVLELDYYEHRSKERESLNIGEFVHFWCGATAFDLTFLAQDAFGWNEDYENMFAVARSQFVWTSGLYNLSTTRTRVKPKVTNSDQINTGIPDESMTMAIPAEFDTSTIKSEDKDRRQLITGLSAGGAVTIIFFVALIIFIILYYKKTVQSLRSEIRSLTSKEVKYFFQGDSNVNQNQAESLIQSIPFVRDYEISRDRLIFSQDNVIGSGEYGCVMHGFVRQLNSEELLPVAIKTVKPNVEVAQFKAMLSEAKIMAFLEKHDNIVMLWGTYTANIKNREIYIALELCTLGDLQKFLKNNAKEYKHTASLEMKSNNEDTEGGVSISTLNLYQWSHNISNAMIYLAEKKIIHGDLAARNVLLTSNRVAKISDFGLSRQLLNYAHYMKTARTPLPWRWMAVESLQDMEFSVASDVWAFGVTLWEIFSLGATPYPGWTWDYGFVNRLNRGDRLEAPTYADTSTCDLMQSCWKLEPSERPSFQAIHNILGELVIKHSTTFSPNYVDLIPTEI